MNTLLNTRKEKLTRSIFKTPLNKTLIMGVLNMTPDSFFERYTQFDAALFRVEGMIKEGVDIVDIGGESTRPGSISISESVEVERVLPIIQAVRQRFDIAISVDTSTALVMKEAAAVGVQLINDVRALTRPGAIEAAAETGLAICLMHMQGQPDNMQTAPQYVDVIETIYSFFKTRIDACARAGIDPDLICLDPGFGFGKTIEHNKQIVSDFERFVDLGHPLLVGVSRKSMIGLLLDNPKHDRLFGSLTVAVMLRLRGAGIIRTHDVQATVDAMKVIDAIREEVVDYA